MGNINKMRFIAFDYQVGVPVFAVLIDRESKTLAFYHKHWHGQIYNLQKPVCVEVNSKMKQGLIRRTQGNYENTQKALDGHIYYYLMTQEERDKCINKPCSPYEKKIIETENFHEAIRFICEKAYNHNRKDKNDMTDNLRYCEDFLKENPLPPIPSLKERNNIVR